jgi:hypothetical protein
MSLTALGLMLLSRLGLGAGLTDVLPGLLVAGLGSGLTTPLFSVILGAVPTDKAGTASGP